jgi:hypothetical protein
MTDATSQADVLIAPPSVVVQARPAASGPRAHVFGPLIDFLCLGGGSVIVCGLIVLLLPKGIPDVQMAALITVLVTAINQPHFAHSYQMFYANFHKKAFGTAYPSALRARYIVSGMIVPLALIAWAVASMVSGSALALSYGINLMFFLVGWHYVKQGYGILILDSVQKRLFFSDRAKTILRINGYACWLAAWLGVNHAVTSQPYVGITFYSFAVPVALYYASIAAAALTSAASLWAVFQRGCETRGALPWNGIVAYVTTVYLWVLFVNLNPLVVAILPSFHSLQYLAVVWRYQLNVRRDAPEASLAFFILTGILLGVLGFAGLPNALAIWLPYDKSVFGPSAYILICLLFINVHHYFLDSVMWRRGNPDIQKYLFARA